MKEQAGVDCIAFTECIPNECWKKSSAGSDPNSITPKVLVINKLERTELVFSKVGSTIVIKDNRLCYHKSNLVRIDEL